MKSLILATTVLILGFVEIGAEFPPLTAARVDEIKADLLTFLRANGKYFGRAVRLSKYMIGVQICAGIKIPTLEIRVNFPNL